MTPLVSVVMSVYDGEKYLAEAIESILNQTFRDFEFIIIDDRSNDKSLEIVREYAGKDGRIKIIENDANMGLARSLNKGIELSSGKYIARMDADDISLPDRFEKQVEYMEDHPEVWVLGGNYLVINDAGIPIKKSVYSNDPHILRWNMMLGMVGIVCHPTVMMRRDMFAQIGMYRDISTSQDLDLWTRLFFYENLPIRNMQNIVLKYRSHSDRISNKRNELQWRNSDTIRAELVKKFTGNEIPLEACYFYRSNVRLQFSKETQRYYIGIWLDIYSKFIDAYKVPPKTRSEIYDQILFQIGSKISFSPLDIFSKGKMCAWSELFVNPDLKLSDLARAFYLRFVSFLDGEFSRLLFTWNLRKRNDFFTS